VRHRRIGRRYRTRGRTQQEGARNGVHQPVVGHVAWSWVDAQLRAARSIWLASTRPDGRPHAMPVWFWWDADGTTPTVYFLTVRSTQKAHNLAARSDVVLHLGDGDDVIVVMGRASKVADPAEAERVDEAYRRKYVDPHTGRRASVFDNPEDDIYRVPVERVLAWMYGVVATRTEWRFDAR
jgi:nitroimidazol reductase NimA-like FMN-containing flavoprotein (pyridoxamine 5'-phosphate oxidase superfamily)